METPTIGPVHEALARLAGGWRGEEVITPSPWSPGGRAEARVSFTVAAGGFVVLQDYVSSRDGVPLLSGHGVFSVDPVTGGVRWHWFDSIGYPPSEGAVGGWKDDELSLERTTERGTNRTTLRLGRDHLHQVISFAAPGEEGHEMVSAGYVRD